MCWPEVSVRGADQKPEAVAVQSLTTYMMGQLTLRSLPLYTIAKAPCPSLSLKS